MFSFSNLQNTRTAWAITPTLEATEPAVAAAACNCSLRNPVRRAPLFSKSKNSHRSKKVRMIWTQDVQYQVESSSPVSFRISLQIAIKEQTISSSCLIFCGCSTCLKLPAFFPYSDRNSLSPACRRVSYGGLLSKESCTQILQHYGRGQHSAAVLYPPFAPSIAPPASCAPHELKRGAASKGPRPNPCHWPGPSLSGAIMIV